MMSISLSNGRTKPIPIQKPSNATLEKLKGENRFQLELTIEEEPPRLHVHARRDSRRKRNEYSFATKNYLVHRNQIVVMVAEQPIIFEFPYR
jgi:hypothetical protein